MLGMSSKPEIPTPAACEQARERILDAAFTEIRRQGYQAASVAAILAATGLTKGALYHYFPSKKALGLAVVDERVSRALHCSVLDRLELVEGDPAPLDKLFALLDSVRLWTDDGIRLGCPLNNLMQEMSGVDEDFRRHLTDILLLWQEKLARLLRQAQLQGQVALTVDCTAAALFIVSAWEGSISIAKNLQSCQAFTAAMAQLHAYVHSLMVK